MRLSLRIALVALVLVIALSATACGSGSTAPTGSAADIAGKVFAEAGVEPFGAATSITNDQEMEYFLGSTNYPEFTDTAVVQPMISIDARIMYVLKVATEKDAAAVMKQLETDVDPARLVCVQFSMDDVEIKNRDTAVFMVIDADHDQRNALASAFDKID